MRGRRELRLLWRASPALLAWWAAGCEVIVDGRLGTVLCQAEGQIGPPACPAGFECVLGTCVPGALGAPCTSDADCDASDFCFDPGPLGGAGPARCSRTCCTSSDCGPDADFVCWLPPHGPGGFCRSASEIGRTGGGTLPALASCAADGECRSGLCSSGACADTCCTDTSCTADGREGFCRVEPTAVLGGLGFWCAQPSSSALGALYAPCQGDSDCASGLCVDFGTKLPMCSQPCCTSEECGSYDDEPIHCVTLTGVHAGVRACGPMSTADGGQGTLAVGEPCSEPGDCRGGICLDSLCSDTCCDDSSCGDSTLFVCRPEETDGAWALRCEPK